MLSISKVETFYGNIQALRGVDVKVNDGEIVALIGSNGAGKSTLLMTISGVNKAATGEILFDSKSIVNMPPHDIVNLGISQVPEGRRISILWIFRSDTKDIPNTLSFGTLRAILHYTVRIAFMKNKTLL